MATVVGVVDATSAALTAFAVAVANDVAAAAAATAVAVAVAVPVAGTTEDALLLAALRPSKQQIMSLPLR